jgi:Flp pilus assembly protein TadG
MRADNKANNKPNQTLNKNTQRGAALVEFSIACTVFLLLVFGIIELGLTCHAWNRVSEAGRDAARFLLVNSPPADLTGQCAAAAPAAITVNCGGGACPALMSRMQAQAPFVPDSAVAVSYTCSAAGNAAVPDDSRVRIVTLSISGVPNYLGNPALGWLGWSGASTLPPVTITRSGEALYSLTP